MYSKLNKKSKPFYPSKKGSSTSKAFTRKAPLYRPPSDQFHVNLTWSGTYDFNVASFQNENYGLSSYGTRVPKYSDQFFGIYKYAYIDAVHFTFEIVCLELKPVRLVLAESNTQDVTPTSFLELSETPRARSVIASQGGNHQVVKLQRTSRASAVVGHRLEDDEQFWITQPSGPVAPIQPLMVFGFEPILSGTTANIAVLVTVVYSMKFFTLNHL
jgi:hypothetical protein